MDTINLLVTFDKNMIEPFETMIYSMAMNNPGERFCVWLIHSNLTEAELERVKRYCEVLKMKFYALVIDQSYFADAPIMQRYPREMYYRLLAPQVLPQELKKMIYIDPDILVLNRIRPLIELDLQGKIFAAASHSGGFYLVNDINRIRLDTEQDYFNTGLILFDLEKARENVKADDIFAYVRQHAQELMLPDQDVFNALYGDVTYPLEDRIWNYDSRHYNNYRIREGGLCDMEWVMDHTVILHFCGKNKPWKKSYSGRFAALYKHYQRQARLREERGEN